MDSKIDELMALFNECLQEAKDFGHLDESPTRNAFVSALEAALKQHPLPDDLYDSKDWKAGGYAERVEWLHIMYESKKQELAAALQTQTPPPRLTDDEFKAIYTQWEESAGSSSGWTLERAVESAVRKQFGVNDE